MRISQNTRDLWAVQYRDCAVEPIDLDLDRARFIFRAHAAHGGGCLPYLAAMAYSFGTEA